MKERAALVIIGAGIVGCSTAYHLAQRGWRDIVVLDQGALPAAGGSTSHAPGLVFQTNPAKTMTAFAKATVKVYSQLEHEGRPCYYPVGSLEVAQTAARWQDLKRRLGYARAYGLTARLISPQEVKALIPILNPDVIHGAYQVEGDGIAKAVWLCDAMRRAVEAQGGAFYGHTPVTKVETANGRVQAVITPAGRIATERVLICAGIWGPRFGRIAGISIPLMPVQHQYTRTSPLRELTGETREVVHPILRHQDKDMYFRQHAECYGVGSYQHEPRLVEADDIVSPDRAKVMPSVMDFTDEDFTGAWQSAVELLPPLQDTTLTYKINGMFSFTPDGFPILGESHDVRGLWVAEAIWVTHAGGVGQTVAEWMDEGTTALDLRECDLHRFHAHVHSKPYLRARGAQQYREIYDITHPLQQMENPRNLRLTPFHPRLVELGAVFFEGAGWERPQWFAANEPLLSKYTVPERTGWAARYWSPIQGAEHQATRAAAALYDLTPFTKIEVKGPGALAFLQYLTTNQMDQPVGKVVYTSMLNARAGIMCDLTVTRLAHDRFLVLTGGGVGMHDLAWLRAHAPADGSVQITDITSALCTVGLWGPKARAVLQTVCEDDLSNAAFPYYTAQRITVGMTSVLALRVSYVGELGWELYAPVEHGLALWDALWAAGQPHGLIAAGGGAFDSLRLEKGYRLWGNDIHSEYNNDEAGLSFIVRANKGDFMGRDALLRSKEQGIARKLCCLTFDEPGAVAMGKEPIVAGDTVLGYVTSTNTGYTVGKGIAYGYLPLAYAREGTKVAVQYFGQPYPATVTAEPLFDPTGTRLKS